MQLIANVGINWWTKGDKAHLTHEHVFRGSKGAAPPSNGHPAPAAPVNVGVVVDAGVGQVQFDDGARPGPYQGGSLSLRGCPLGWDR